MLTSWQRIWIYCTEPVYQSVDEEFSSPYVISILHSVFTIQKHFFFSSALLFPILLWSQLVAMRKVWWNTPEITLVPNGSPGSKMLHPSAAVWCGTDKKVWLSSSHILPRERRANVKTIPRWAEILRLIPCLVPTEMWCFCVLSAFGCSSVPFQWTWTEFLIWHRCQERALSLNKD